MTPSEVNKIIDSCIDNLADDSIDVGADSLFELAIIWAKAGMNEQSFLDMRKYIVKQAKLKTNELFIDEKLRIAEKKMALLRNEGNTIINVHNRVIH